MSIEPLVLSAFTLTTALGRGCARNWEAVRAGRTGLRANDFADAQVPTWIGRVDGIEDAPLTGELAPFDCRNNRLGRIGLEQDGFADAVCAAVRRYTAPRVGVFLGTSTSGIEETERAYATLPAPDAPLPASLRFPKTHDPASPVAFLRAALGPAGPGLSISTACSSSAKVFASAHRAIAAGLCDAAVVGGVDSLCLTTLYGFKSLDLVSQHPCRPWDMRRDGINIGEAAGFALLEKRTAASPAAPRPVALLGYGESSDAHHMTAPHPEGAGAARAMRAALERGGLTAAEIGYVNLHGTATPTNDASEDRAVTSVLGGQVPCSSTKGWTGHTLGAAGIVEAILTALALQHGHLPQTLNLEQRDSALAANVLAAPVEARIQYALSNSFGFGGNNCSLLLGLAP